MAVLSVCPRNANERLAKAGAGKVPPLPCRTTVFEGMDGKIYLVRTNTANLAKLMQDSPAAKVLTEIAQEESTVYDSLVQ